jgi:hypothetical protein
LPSLDPFELVCLISHSSSYSFLGTSAGSSSRPKIKKQKLQCTHDDDDDDEIVSKEEVISPPKSRRQLSQEAKVVERAAKEAKLQATKLDKWTKHG